MWLAHAVGDPAQQHDRLAHRPDHGATDGDRDGNTDCGEVEVVAREDRMPGHGGGHDDGQDAGDAQYLGHAGKMNDE